MAMSKLCSIVLAGLLPLFAIPAFGGPIGFTFTGQVTDDAINGSGGLVNCGVVTGSYTFDSAAVDGNPASTAGLYAAISITFSIDNVLFFSSTSGVVNAANFPAVDQYGRLATGIAAAYPDIPAAVLIQPDHFISGSPPPSRLRQKHDRESRAGES
jgi:hypothetical protein